MQGSLAALDAEGPASVTQCQRWCPFLRFQEWYREMGLVFSAYAWFSPYLVSTFSVNWPVVWNDLHVQGVGVAFGCFKSSVLSSILLEFLVKNL